MFLTLLHVCTVRTKHGAQPRPHDDVITLLSTSVFGLFVKKELDKYTTVKNETCLFVIVSLFTVADWSSPFWQANQKQTDEDKRIITIS